MGDRRKRGGKGVAGLLGLAALAALIGGYLRFGLPGGLGLGDEESAGGATAKAARPDAGPPCELRLDARGLQVDGKRRRIAVAAKLCAGRGPARLLVTGDARQGQLDELRAAFAAAGVELFVR
jgi:hypothetical protein